MAKYQKEEEEKTLKAITLFCFPEGINWAPLTEYHRSVSPSCILQSHAILQSIPSSHPTSSDRTTPPYCEIPSCSPTQAYRPTQSYNPT